MIKEVNNEKNILIIKSDTGSKTINFKENVKTVLKINNSVVVRTAHDPQQGARNICRFDEAGAKIWIVEEPDGAKGQANAFMDLWLDQSGKLMGGTWQGMEYEIDFETGKLLKSKFTK